MSSDYDKTCALESGLDRLSWLSCLYCMLSSIFSSKDCMRAFCRWVDIKLAAHNTCSTQFPWLQLLGCKARRESRKCPAGPLDNTWTGQIQKGCFGAFQNLKYATLVSTIRAFLQITTQYRAQTDQASYWKNTGASKMQFNRSCGPQTALVPKYPGPVKCVGLQ